MLCPAGLKATSSHQASRTKKAVARKQKRKSKAADPMDDAAEAVLQGQQQVLGDLSQAGCLPYQTTHIHYS